MKMKNVANTKPVVGEENEEEIERDIASVLLFSGYEPDSDEWTSAMIRWKLRRKSNPRLYKKFIELD